MSDVKIRLYITGRTARSSRAIASLRRICEQDLAGQGTLEIVDALEEPERAEQEKIIATPTAIRVLPLPPRRVIGDLADPAAVLNALDLRPSPAPHSQTDPRHV